MKTLANITINASTRRSVFVSLLIGVLLVFVVVVKGQQDDPCQDTSFLSGTGLSDYIDCVTSSPGCIDCDSSSVSMDDFSAGGSVPSTNEDIEMLLCPAVNCCSACVDQSRALLQCSANAICSAFAITDCSLDCPTETFPYGDSDSVPDECDVAVGAFASCLAREGSCFSTDPNAEEQCLAKLDDLESSTASATASSVADSCAFAELYFCTYIECCPTCQDELQALYVCEENALTDCDLTCTDAIDNGGDSAPTITTTTDPPAATPPAATPTTSAESPSPVAEAGSSSPETSSAARRDFSILALVSFTKAVALVF
jgi:hypothetical protein